MSDELTNIEDYFNGNLSPQARQEFEDKCASDPAFANEVAFYISLRDKMKQELYEEKKKAFDGLYAQLSQQRKPVIRRIYPYVAAAAACLILFIGWRLFFAAPSMQTLADNYIEENLRTLGISMGGQQDFLRAGVDAYNKGNYTEAEREFKLILNVDPGNPEAAQYLGQVFLVTERYDEAIAEFDKLSKNTKLYANPGLFYKAIALMKRGRPGDKQQAKQTLQEVAEKKLAGSKQADAWLNKI